MDISHEVSLEFVVVRLICGDGAFCKYTRKPSKVEGRDEMTSASLAYLLGKSPEIKKEFEFQFTSWSVS